FPSRSHARSGRTLEMSQPRHLLTIVPACRTERSATRSRSGRLNPRQTIRTKPPSNARRKKLNHALFILEELPWPLEIVPLTRSIHLPTNPQACSTQHTFPLPINKLR